MSVEQVVEGLPYGYSLALNRALLQLNELCSWPERIAASPWSRRMPIDRPIFIVGAFRSGTTVLEQALARHPQVGVFAFITNVAYLTPIGGFTLVWLMSRCGIVEGRRMPYLYNPRLEFTPFSPFECEWVWAQAGKDLWDPNCTDLTTDAGYSNPQFERMVRSTIRRHLLVQGAQRFLNKNPIHLLRLEYLLKLFPDARFVYIVRNPAATVLSHYRMVQRIAAVIHPHPKAREAVERGLHLDVLTPRIKSTRYAETLAWERIHPLLGIAHQWRIMHETALASLEGNSTLARQTLRISYEALNAEPSRILSAVWRFVGLDDAAAEAITRQAVSYLTPPQPVTPTPEEARWLPVVKELVAPAAERLGYARQAETDGQ